MGPADQLAMRHAAARELVDRAMASAFGLAAAAAKPPAPPPRRRAWVSLLTDESYAVGVTALQRSLVVADTEYPLIVMVTSAVGERVREQLVIEGCELRDVAPLPLPAGTGGLPVYAVAHFADCWIKLRMWEWEDEFERIVYLDADMLVLRCIDELLEDGAPRWLRAVQECFCPVAARRHLCPYRQDAATARDEAGSRYFNAGMLVLTPNREVAADFARELARSDLSRFPFAEQDFLNHYFGGAWQPLSWAYNATKAHYACHRDSLWDFGACKVVHFTMAKPWDLRHKCNAGCACRPSARMPIRALSAPPLRTAAVARHGTDAERRHSGDRACACIVHAQVRQAESAVVGRLLRTAYALATAAATPLAR